MSSLLSSSPLVTPKRPVLDRVRCGFSPSLGEAISTFLATKRHLSPATSGWYGDRLAPLVEWLREQQEDPYHLPLREVTAAMLRSFVEAYGQRPRVSRGTVCATVRALRILFRWAKRQGLVEENPTSEDALGRFTAPKFIPKVLQPGDLVKLLSQVNTSKKQGKRDLALLLFLVSSGARISEALGLQVGDLDLRDRAAKVKGKGSKERMIAFGQDAARALAEYLRARGDLADDAPAFAAGGEKPLSKSQAASIMRVYARKAGLQKVTCHTLRRTFATRAIACGMNLFSVQQVLGHSDLTMVRHYAAISNEDALRDHQKIDVVGAMLGVERRLVLPRR